MRLAVPGGERVAVASVTAMPVARDVRGDA
jgi:hypothetical protein